MTSVVDSTSLIFLQVIWDLITAASSFIAPYLYTVTSVVSQELLTSPHPPIESASQFNLRVNVECCTTLKFVSQQVQDASETNG